MHARTHAHTHTHTHTRIQVRRIQDQYLAELERVNTLCSEQSSRWWLFVLIFFSFLSFFLGWWKTNLITQDPRDCPGPTTDVYLREIMCRHVSVSLCSDQSSRFSFLLSFFLSNSWKLVRPPTNIFFTFYLSACAEYIYTRVFDVRSLIDLLYEIHIQMIIMDMYERVFDVTSQIDLLRMTIITFITLNISLVPLI